MKPRFITPRLLSAVLFFATSHSQAQDTAKTPQIDKVFFAQHHVLEPANPLFRLVGELPALIKVQVYADTPTEAPLVLATLELDSQSMQMPLIGPKLLPQRPAGDPLLMEHAYHDSFTAMIPRDWVKTGLNRFNRDTPLV